MKQFFSMADPPLLKALLWGLLVFLQFHEHAACFHEERIALLELKVFLKSNIIYGGHPLLPSWIDDAKSDCCGWERVTCNSTTAHVINFSLYNLNQDPDYEDPYYYYFKYEEKKQYWLLNMSLLAPFKELRSLNLSGNVIGGCLPNEDVASQSQTRRGLLDPTAAEGVAAIMAAQLCVELGIQQVQLKGDAKTIIAAINSVDPDESGRGQLTEDIRFLLRSIPVLEMCYTRRKGNKVAHALARLATHEPLNMVWYNNPPNWIRDLLQAEISALQHLQ